MKKLTAFTVAVLVGAGVLAQDASSADATRKFRNMQDDPRVAFVIGWENNKSLQYEGVVDEPLGREQERIVGHFFSAFPNKLSHRHWPGNHYFRVRPRWVRYSDYNSPGWWRSITFLLPQVKF